MNPGPFRVAHIVTSGGVGGAQRNIALLAPRLRPDFECEVASGPGEWLPAALARAGVRHHPVPGLRNAFSPADAASFADLRRWLRQGRFDLVHTHSSKAGLLGRLAARATGLPAVFTAHGLAFADATLPQWQRTGWAAVERGLARISEAIITVSDADAELAQRSGVRARLGNRLIWNGIDPGGWQGGPPRAAARKTLGVPAGAWVVGTVMRLAPPKDPEGLLRALALVPEATLLVVGGGPLQAALARLAADLGVSARVTWLGHRDDVRTCLRAMDIFTLPSYKEGAPYTLLEAMAAGVVPVVTAVGGMPTMVDGHGLVVPPGRPDLLAAAWRQAREMPPPPSHAVPDVMQQAAETAAVYREVLARTG